MEHHGPTSWLLKLPFLPHDYQYQHVNGAVLVFMVILVSSIIARRQLSRSIEAYVIPSKKATLVNIIDVLIESLYGMVTDVLGKSGAQYFPLIATMFIFVLLCNLLGLLPLASAPTSVTSTTFGLGLASFIYYNTMGIREHGILGYLKQFLAGLGRQALLLLFSRWCPMLSARFRSASGSM